MDPSPAWPPLGRSAVGLLADVAAALDGGPPLVLASAARALERYGDGLPAAAGDSGVAALAGTSGSTGRPRTVLLDAEALLASARATHARLGGAGRWLLALPVDHVAGFQVLVRSVLAGEAPTTADPSDTDAIGAAAAGARYAALVPTQLHRVVAAAGASGLPPTLAPLTGLDAILVGGAATAPGLLARARHLGLRVVTTYGATETCGGCVYDGVPLDGVEVALDEGVVLLSGTVARGYADGGPGIEVRDGRRWFRSSDLGRLVAGRLEVLGRADDAIVVGGHKVAPSAVERVLGELAEVAEVAVVPRASERWGAVPVAVVVPAPGATPTLDRLRDAASAALGRAAAPRALITVEALPLIGPGKVDRAALARVAASGAAD